MMNLINMLQTLQLKDIFPATPDHITAILRAKNATEVYRLAGDVYYVIKKKK
jgi:hypothetical protein